MNKNYSYTESNEVKVITSQQLCTCSCCERTKATSGIQIANLMKKCSDQASEISALNKSLKYYKSLFEKLSNSAKVMVSRCDETFTKQIKSEPIAQIGREPIASLKVKSSDQLFKPPEDTVMSIDPPEDPISKRKNSRELSTLKMLESLKCFYHTFLSSI